MNEPKDFMTSDTSSFSSTSTTAPAKDAVGEMGAILNQYTVLLIILLCTLFVIMIIVSIYAYNIIQKGKQLLASVPSNNPLSMSSVVKIIKVEKSSISGDDSGGILDLPYVTVEYQSTTEISDLSEEYKLPTDKSWEFPRKNLQFEIIIGEGAFGAVFKAEAIGIIADDVMTTVAVKMLKGHHSEIDMINLVIEMEILKSIGKHENILSLLGCCTQGGPLYVIMEYVSRGNLRDFLIDHRGFSGFIPPTERNDRGSIFLLSEKNLVRFALQIATGMEYLVSRRCVHRDLAARNILVAEDYAMKIADFGLARDIHRSNYYKRSTEGIMLPLRWMAPEAIRFNLSTIKGDVWSFGIVMWEIMALGDTPYRDLPNDERLFEIHRSGYRLPKPKNCSDSIYNVMYSCWSYQLQDRPNFSDLVKILSGVHAETNSEIAIDARLPTVETPPSSPNSCA